MLILALNPGIHYGIQFNAVTLCTLSLYDPFTPCTSAELILSVLYKIQMLQVKFSPAPRPMDNCKPHWSPQQRVVHAGISCRGEHPSPSPRAYPHAVSGPAFLASTICKARCCYCLVIASLPHSFSISATLAFNHVAPSMQELQASFPRKRKDGHMSRSWYRSGKA